MVTEFIWDKKIPKISYDRLIAAYIHGGLQLRDLTTINKAIKFNKINQLLDPKFNAFWKNVFQAKYGVELEYLFECNMYAKDISVCLKDNYVKELLILWSTENYCVPQDVNQILAQKIWYNSNIKRRGKWMFFNSLYKISIKKLIDLYDLDTGNFYDCNQFCQMFENPHIDYVSYYGIIDAIPREWNNILKQNLPSTQENQLWSQQFKILCDKGKPTRVLYNYYRDKQAKQNDGLILLWKNDLAVDIQKKTFEKLFLKMKKISSSTKLRYFQYRLLVRALTLNIHVSKWDKDVSSRCSFCDNFHETTVHFFVECEKVKKLWTLKKWIKYNFQITVDFSPSVVIFNNYRGPHNELVNKYIFITKFYLYRTRVQKSSINFSHLITEVSKIKNIEKIIANVSGTINKFSYEWNEYEV